MPIALSVDSKVGIYWSVIIWEDSIEWFTNFAKKKFKGHLNVGKHKKVTRRNFFTEELPKM
jgi:hypothetical protein